MWETSSGENTWWGYRTVRDWNKYDEGVYRRDVERRVYLTGVEDTNSNKEETPLQRLRVDIRKDEKGETEGYCREPGKDLILRYRNWSHFPYTCPFVVQKRSLGLRRLIIDTWTPLSVGSQERTIFPLIITSRGVLTKLRTCILHPPFTDRPTD